MATAAGVAEFVRIPTLAENWYPNYELGSEFSRILLRHLHVSAAIVRHSSGLTAVCVVRLHEQAIAISPRARQCAAWRLVAIGSLRQAGGACRCNIGPRQDAMALFDSRFIRQLDRLELLWRRTAHGALLAERRGSLPGAGLEFADHRLYSPGDDFRRLDWNVYARHEQLLIKRAYDERELDVYVLVDCSRSMDFGSPTKFDCARRLAAALAYLALGQSDRVWVLGFAAELLTGVHAMRGKAGIFPVLAWLERLAPRETATDLARSMRAFLSRRQPRGLAVLISDFYDATGFQAGLDLLRQAHRVQVAQIHTPDEADPARSSDARLPGAVLCDIETGVRHSVEISGPLLDSYRAAFAGFQQSLAAYCGRHGLGLIAAPTSMTLDALLLALLKKARRVGCPA